MMRMRRKLLPMSMLKVRMTRKFLIPPLLVYALRMVFFFSFASEYFADLKIVGCVGF